MSKLGDVLHKFADHLGAQTMHDLIDEAVEEVEDYLGRGGTGSPEPPPVTPESPAPVTPPSQVSVTGEGESTLA
jgi:hypothetical protein